MPQYTPNLQLYKWDKTDSKVDTITEMASNAHKIDTKLKDVDELIAQINTDLTTTTATANDAVQKIEQVQIESAQAVTTSNEAQGIAESANTKSDEAKTLATDAKNTANTVKTQLDEVTKASTIDPQVSQALVGSDGKTYANIANRFDTVDALMAHKAEQQEVNTVRQQIDNLVLHAGNPESSSAEIMQARDTETVLADRLEKIESGYRLTSAENYVDPSKITLNYYLDGNGNLVSSSNCVSDFIEVNYGDTYSLYGAFSNNIAVVCYDKNKQFLGTLGNGSLDGAYRGWIYKVGYTFNAINGWLVDSKQATIRYVRLNMNQAEIAQMFVKGSTYPTTYIPYSVELKSEQMKNAIQKLFPTKTSELENDSGFLTYKTKTISCWGDSKTQGNQDKTGVTYPNVLKDLLTQNGYNHTVYNMGVGGEYSTSIAGRQGGLPLFVQPFTIPSNTTPVRIKTNIANDNIAKSGFAGLNPCYINGIKGELGYDWTNSYSTFRRIETGTSVEIIRPTQIVTDGMINHRDDILIIDIGANGGYGSVSEWLQQIRSMIDYSQQKEFIVISRNSENENPAFSNAKIEPEFKKEFGNRYINLREYMVTPIYEADGTSIKSCYGLDDVGLTPTLEDLTAIEQGKLPPSLMHDPVHENQYGYRIKAQQVFKKLQELQIIVA